MLGHRPSSEGNARGVSRASLPRGGFDPPPIFHGGDHIASGGGGQADSPQLIPFSCLADTDPALGDVELARHLQRNQALGVQRLEEVITQYAQLQDKSEEQQQGGKPPRQDGGGTPPSRAVEGEPASPKESVSGTAAKEVRGGRGAVEYLEVGASRGPGSSWWGLWDGWGTQPPAFERPAELTRGLSNSEVLLGHVVKSMGSHGAEGGQLGPAQYAFS